MGRYLARLDAPASAHLDRLEVDWSSGAPAPAARDGRDRNTSSGLVRTPVSFPVFLNRCAGTSRARNAAGWSCYSHDPCLMLDGCESCVRLCDPCARVSPCELVPCVRCVPAVPQVSFYWNFKNTGGSRTHDRQTRTSLGSSGRLGPPLCFEGGLPKHENTKHRPVVPAQNTKTQNTGPCGPPKTRKHGNTMLRAC